MKRAKSIKRFFVYILKCKDGTFYTGYTNNLKKRIALHNTGKGAKYVKGRGPVKLVYAKVYVFRRHAMNTERKIKTMSKKRKIKLIGTCGKIIQRFLK